ncbi:hypothetical protein LCGC14_2681990, partial [marine sediment metagenome]
QHSRHRRSSEAWGVALSCSVPKPVKGDPHLFPEVSDHFCCLPPQRTRKTTISRSHTSPLLTSGRVGEVAVGVTARGTHRRAPPAPRERSPLFALLTFMIHAGVCSVKAPPTASVKRLRKYPPSDGPLCTPAVLREPCPRTRQQLGQGCASKSVLSAGRLLR